MTDEPQKSEAAKSSNEPPAKTEHKKAAPRKSRPHPKRSSHLGFILLIILGILLVAGWYGYDIYKQTRSSLDALQTSQSSLVSQNQDFEDKLNARFVQMQKQQRELANYIEVLREKDQHLRKDWLLLESEYLIQLANYRLLFERDINTAIAALSAADTRLKETGDPGLVAVRKSIAEAIQSLKQIPQADLVGLSLSLSTINKDIDKLPLKTPDPKSRASQQTQEVESKNVESWTELPAAMWRDIKNLIVIRDHEQPVQPLLSPDERFFLIENLRLQIEQARLAMLSGQAKVFKERITTAINWIDQHFDKELPVTIATLDTLNKLANQNIAPKLPDIAYTYQSLQKYRLRVTPSSSNSKKPGSGRKASTSDAVEKQPEVKHATPPAKPAPATTTDSNTGT